MALNPHDGKQNGHETKKNETRKVKMNHETRKDETRGTRMNHET